MEKKYYLDACIWIDYFENRKDRFRPLGDWAIRIINKIIKENGLFIFSDHIIKELEKNYTKEELKPGKKYFQWLNTFVFSAIFFIFMLHLKILLIVAISLVRSNT